MKIFVGADHRGFELKEKIKTWLAEWKYEFEDEGAHQLDPDDDYTTYASRVAIKVSENPESLGILSCGSGVGVDITANKFDGARASVAISSPQIAAGRHDDNMNILVLAADYLDEHQVKRILRAFLETEYKPKERYENRLRDIKIIEENN